MTANTGFPIRSGMTAGDSLSQNENDNRGNESKNNTWSVVF